MRAAGLHPRVSLSLLGTVSVAVWYYQLVVCAGCRAAPHGVLSQHVRDGSILQCGSMGILCVMVATHVHTAPHRVTSMHNKGLHHGVA